jgi:hypothetical protein
MQPFLLGQREIAGQHKRFKQKTKTTTTITTAADAVRKSGRESAKKQVKAESQDADLEEALSVNVVVDSLPVPAHKHEAVPVTGEAELHI